MVKLDKLQEIKEALNKATPGPWKWKEGNKEHRDLGAFVGADGFNLCWFGNTSRYYPIAGEEPETHDYHLIAKAPEYISYLLQLVEEQRKAMQAIADIGKDENPCK